MEKEYEIFVDMAVDIDKKVAEEIHLHFVPMEFSLGDKTMVVTELQSDEMMHEFYEGMRQNLPTKTSQITPYQYEETFLPYIREGKSILYIALSSGLSKTSESALLAVQSIKDQYEDAQIEVVDSYTSTGGIGLLTDSAAKNRDAGMSLAENAAWLRENVHNVNHWLMVDDLSYLKRGGRVSATTDPSGSGLNIKPVLKFNAIGKLGVAANIRGRKRGMRYLVDRYKERLDPHYGDIAYICCADCKDSAEELKQMVLEVNPNADVYITMLSPVIGAHTGPGMISLTYYGEKME